MKSLTFWHKCTDITEEISQFKSRKQHKRIKEENTTKNRGRTEHTQTHKSLCSSKSLQAHILAEYSYAPQAQWLYWNQRSQQHHTKEAFKFKSVKQDSKASLQQKTLQKILFSMTLF